MPFLTRADLTRVRVLTALGVLTLTALLVRLALFDLRSGNTLFHPHGYCYLWQTDLVAAHVISDALIGLSYIAISISLVYLVKRARQHLPFSWMFVAFGAFIIACGATHLMEVWTLWTPVYWLSADVKIITAVASLATAVALPPLIPKVLLVVQQAELSEQRRRALEQAHAELERRVAERTAALREALERAEEANRAKAAFLATVSHELRTPLHAIVGWAGILRQRPPDPATLTQGLEVIERNSRLQTQLVEDLLEISAASLAKLELQIATLDLARVVADSVETMRPAATAKDVHLSLTPADVPLAVAGDERRLQQVMANLLANAVKFTSAGGRIDVCLRAEDGDAIVDVQDTGIGIAPDFVPQLFQPFAQQDASSKRTHYGIGLGLSIARELVELHGGRIEATSAGVGRGATFRIRLPLVRERSRTAT